MTQERDVKQVRTRLSFLMMCGLIAVVAVACGRASEEDIYQALGVTPTPTLSDQQIADETAAAVSEEETQVAVETAMAASPVDGGSGVDLAAAGNPVMGRTTFLQRCQSCHRPGGAGPAPDLTVPGNPATALTDQEIVDLVRTGEGHGGTVPFDEVALREQQLYDVLAFIREQSQ
jgi:mono/diheme cytochrome c family protein